MKCSSCHRYEAAFSLKERATGEISHLCVDCLVKLCLSGALMHPDPRYEYVYATPAE